MGAQFGNPFDAIAIRLEPLTEIAGSLKDHRPVAIFAQQGVASAGLGGSHGARNDGQAELGAGHPFGDHSLAVPEMARGRLSPQFKLHRVIFVVDRSSSMSEALVLGRPEGKLAYVKERIAALANDYFPPDCKLSLFSFDNKLDPPLDLGAVGEGGMRRLKDGIGALYPRGGTYFRKPFRECERTLRADYLEAQALGINVRDEGLRSLVVFLTDGRDCPSARAEVAGFAANMRDLNATCMIMGIGADYEMKRIIQISGQTGASMWSHLPLEDRTLDPFDVQIPAAIAQIFDSEFYFTIDAEGGFQQFSALSPSLRFAEWDGKRIYSGYERAPMSLLFEREDNLELTLNAGRRVNDPSAQKFEIPIVDAQNAVGKYEEVQRAREFTDRFLAMRAMLNRDLKALREMMCRNPSLERVLGEAVRQVQDHEHTGQYDQGSQEIHSSMSVMGLAMSQIIPMPPGAPNTAGETNANVGGTMEFGAPPADIPRESVGNSSGSRADSGQPRSEHYYSGLLGPLSLSPDSVAPLPSKLDPRRYDQAVPLQFGSPILRFGAPLKVYAGPVPFERLHFALTDLQNGEKYVMGRQPDYPGARPIIILSSALLSRTHCVFYSEQGMLFIEDLGSANGTKVNGVKIDKSRAIQSGDVITLPGIAPITFEFSQRA